MDQAGQNSANNPDWLKNFGMPKNTRQNDALDRAIYAAKNQAADVGGSAGPSTNAAPSPQTTASSSSQPLSTSSDSASASSAVSSPAGSPDHPRSAQEIINARYQSQPEIQPSAPRPTLSAREAINGGSAVQNLAPVSEPAKPASRLHRGFIQKSLESTRPSASAILGTNSPDGEVPVVSTSLKLGANVLPEKPAATLPPGARMARAAKSLDREVEHTEPASKKLLGKIGRSKTSSGRTTDAQIILPEIISDDPAPRFRRRSSTANRLADGRSNNAQPSSKHSGSAKSSSERSAMSVGLVAGNVQVALDDTPKPAKRRPRQLSGKVSQIPVMQSGERKIEVHSDDHEEPATKSSPARRARQPLGISSQIALGAGSASRQLRTDPQMISPERPYGPQEASLARPQNSPRSQSPSPRPQNPATAQDHSYPQRSSRRSSLESAAQSSVLTSALVQKSEPNLGPNSNSSLNPNSNPNLAKAKLGAAALQALLDGSIEPEALGLKRSDLQTIAAAKDNQALKAALAGKTVGDLGVIEDYAPAEGRAKGREAEAVGNVGLSARDPKNPKAHKAEDSRRTLGKQSPFFLKSVNVEKRPLSHDNAGIPAGPHSTAPSSPVSPEKPVKLGTVRTVSHRSTFAKASKPPKEKHRKEKSGEQDAGRALPDRPTVIVPASHRSNAPLFFLLILTILLGAAVGAAAYLCFFQ